MLHISHSIVHFQKCEVQKCRSNNVENVGQP